ALQRATDICYRCIQTVSSGTGRLARRDCEGRFGVPPSRDRSARLSGRRADEAVAPIATRPATTLRAQVWDHPIVLYPTLRSRRPHAEPPAAIPSERQGDSPLEGPGE